MRRKPLILMTLLLFFVGILLIQTSFQQPTLEQRNMAEVNDIAQTLAENWENQQVLRQIVFPYALDFVVLDNEGNLIKATKRGLNETVHTAIANRDTLIELEKDNKKIGTLILSNDFAAFLKTHQEQMERNAFGLLLLCITYGIVVTLYFQQTVLQPFHRLKIFAKNIATGNLEVPLPMDKNGRVLNL